MVAEDTQTRSGDGAAGIVFSVQRYCIHDGPGIRTTVFLKGCPLSCAWCHNPESWDTAPEIWLLPQHCIQCGACLEECPRTDQVEPGTALAGPPLLEPDHCLRCGSCVAVCPTSARQQVGRSLQVAELLREVARDRPFYEQSGGGVTFSGGEPLLQYEFLAACLRGCREQRLHTAVDTSGYAPREHLLALARVTDLFLYDLKLMDDQRHREHTGVSVQPILENLVALDAAGAEIWVRLPLIPRVNDDSANLDAIGRFVADLTHTRRLHLLPFHEVGTDKRLRLGKSSESSGCVPSTRETVAEVVRRLTACGLEVHLGG